MERVNDLSGEQWARVKSTFHTALELPLEAREEFVHEVCQGDAALAAAIRSLLASDGSTTDFLEAPAVARIGVPSPGPMALSPGEQLGPYEIVELLGAGGMGEVYRARDARLGRDIALKVLPADLMHDRGHQQRLTSEAQTTARLDHPNICPLFDVGAHDGRVWFAMQYVEGATLAERLRAGPLDVLQAIRITLQIADALEAAHARGIIHRDVKPENVWIATTGQVKVLDFGLAMVAAEHGLRLGTLPYMSPEQVRGEPLDLQTDVYSLCVLLSEMVTGRRPFPIDAEGDLVTDILHATPPAVTELVPGAPFELVRILGRGLEKDVDQRYPRMTALAEDLARLRQRLERPAVEHSSRRALAFVALLAATAISAAVSWLAADRNHASASSPLAYTRLTNFPDSVHSPVLSPDGTKLAFVRGAELFSNAGHGGELYVKALPDGQPVALTHDGVRKFGPTFSPDGSQIVYSIGDWSSFIVPATGGTPTLFMSNASALHWIGPATYLFSAMNAAPNMGIVTATEDRTRAREIYRPSSAQGMAHFSERSPDGRQVLLVEMDRALWLSCRAVPFDGSSLGTQVGPPGAECTSATWSPDGRWMYFAATVNGQSHLWRQRVPDGMPEQITFGPNEERGVAVARDGRSVVTSVTAVQSTVWYHDDRGERSISAEGYAYRPLVSPDGRRVFYLVRQAAKRSLALGELWAVDLVTGTSGRILPGVLMRSYHVSADGAQLVFDGLDDAERSRIWIVPLDRRAPPRQLSVGGADEQRPFFGGSGRIYFLQARAPGQYAFYRMNADGSAREELSERAVHYLVNISPDERWAASWDIGGDVSLVPIGRGDAVPLCRCGLGPIYPDSPSIAWSGDARSIYMFLPSRRETLSLPWRGADAVRALPALDRQDWTGAPGAQRIAEASLAPGPTAATYAFVRQSQQSNLYRIQLPSDGSR
jgi:serine/threonine protein kinase